MTFSVISKILQPYRKRSGKVVTFYQRYLLLRCLISQYLSSKNNLKSPKPAPQFCTHFGRNICYFYLFSQNYIIWFGFWGFLTFFSGLVFFIYTFFPHAIALRMHSATTFKCCWCVSMVLYIFKLLFLWEFFEFQNKF